MKNKLTKEDLAEQIVKTEYTRVGIKTTICTLTLKNGFEVIGTSACVDPVNFDEEIGKKCAYEQAFEKLWELEGYKLQSVIAEGVKSDTGLAIAELKEFSGCTEYGKLIALRADLMDNIKLADSKALGLLQLNPKNNTLIKMCLEVIQPNLETTDAPEGYEIFNATSVEDVEYQCKVLRQIVMAKYAAVNEMIKFIRG